MIEPKLLMLFLAAFCLSFGYTILLGAAAKRVPPGYALSSAAVSLVFALVLILVNTVIT